MKKIMSYVLIFLSAIFTFSTAIAADLTTTINGLITHFKYPVTVSVTVQSLKTGSILYERNDNNPYVPASSLKVYTSSAALLFLGPNFQFPTTIATNSNNINNGVLNGNLYIKFTGDPDLMAGDIIQLIQQLKTAGIRQVTGNVYVDNTTFGGDGIGPGWMWDELANCYASPSTADMIDHNCFVLRFDPSNRVGTPARISTLPTTVAATPLLNNITTAASRSGCNIQIKLKNGEYHLSGCIPYGSKAQAVRVSLPNPDGFMKGLLPQLFQHAGIQINGKIENGVSNANYRILATHLSKPLSGLVKQMLKNSDNQIANALLKTLGAQYYRTAGTWRNGAAAVEAILSRYAHVNFAGMDIVDGDGVSRYNLITGIQTIKLLNYMYHNSAVSQVFINALPTGGVDGTLAYRFHEPFIRAKVHAKTGTMQGLSSLTGYVTTQRNGDYAFVILTNNFVNRPYVIQKLEDDIVKALATS